jgi:hypothetical protein
MSAWLGKDTLVSDLDGEKKSMPSGVGKTHPKRKVSSSPNLTPTDSVTHLNHNTGEITHIIKGKEMSVHLTAWERQNQITAVQNEFRDSGRWSKPNGLVSRIKMDIGKKIGIDEANEIIEQAKSEFDR